DPEDSAARQRRSEGFRPLAAPAVRDEEGAVRPLARTLALAGAVVLVLALWSCFVVIDVTEYGVLTRFGRVARVITEPGLRIKRPYPFETVTRLDRRLLAFKPATAEYLSQDKKNLVIHSLVTWRIADPERFLATVGTRAAAQERLADVVLTKLGAVVGSSPASALGSVDGLASQVHQVMTRLITRAHAPAHAPGLREDPRRQHDRVPARGRGDLPDPQRRAQAQGGEVAHGSADRPAPGRYGHRRSGGSVCAAPEPAARALARRARRHRDRW